MLKGYKSTNRNYITIAEQKTRMTRFKKMLKEERKQKELEAKKQEEYNLQMYIAEKREQKQEAIKHQQNQEYQIKLKKSFLEYAAKNHSYRIYLIAYDICNNDYFNIESDLKKQKIKTEEVKEMLEEATKRGIETSITI